LLGALLGITAWTKSGVIGAPRREEEYMKIARLDLLLSITVFYILRSFLSRWVSVRSRCIIRIATAMTNNQFRSIKLRGAECGIEAVLLGCVTSIGGFLFGYDTVRFSRCHM
jgi:hypothetical protein